MRFFLAVLLAASVALPLRAEPAPDPMNWFAGPAAPQLFAYELDDRGLSRYPYDRVDDYQSGASYQWWGRAARQSTDGSGLATHITTGLRTDGRLGGEFEWTHFASGAFDSQKRPDLVSLRSTADLSKSDDLTLEYGLGITALWADRTYAGIGFAFAAEKRLIEPATLYARWQPSLVAHLAPLNDLSAGIGVSWRWVGVEGGYRALLTSLRHEYGPEVALRIWL